MATEEFKEQFEELCKGYGFKRASYTFSNFAEFKAKWARTDEWIEFRFPDYLKDSPNDICLSFARSIMERMFKGKDLEYGDDFKAYITSEPFIDANANKFLSRSRTTVPTEENVPIRKIADRYGFKGTVGWTKYATVKASTVFNIILIPINANVADNDTLVEKMIRNAANGIAASKIRITPKVSE